MVLLLLHMQYSGNLYYSVLSGDANSGNVCLYAGKYREQIATTTNIESKSIILEVVL